MMTDLSSTILLTVILALSMHRGVTTSNDTTVYTTESQLKQETDMSTKTISNPPNNYSKSADMISTTHKYDYINTTKAAIFAAAHANSSSASGLIKIKTTESSKQSLNNSNNQRTLEISTIKPTQNIILTDTSAISSLGTTNTNVHMSESTSTQEPGSDQTTDNGWTKVTALKSHNTTSPTTKTTMNSSDHTTDEIIGEGHDNGTETGRLKSLFDNFDAGDKLWPVGMALTIAVPTIIVLAVTITVLYKRSVAKPRSRMSFYGQNYAKM